MPRINLQNPVDLGEFVVGDVFMDRPKNSTFQSMLSVRSPTEGFTEDQALYFATQITHFGRLFFLRLDDIDKTAIRRAVNGAFYSEISRRLGQSRRRRGSSQGRPL